MIEGDPLAQLVLRYALSEQMDQEGGSMKMSSSEWLTTLNRFAFGDYPNPPKGWPTTGKVLSDRLKRLQPTLAARGLSVEWGRDKKTRFIEMTRTTGVVPEPRATPAKQTELQGVG